MRALNRITLVLIGLCLLAAGVLGLLVETGALSASAVDSWLAFQRVWEWYSDLAWSTTALVVLSAAAAVLALGFAALALAEVPLRRAGPRGRATIAGGPRGRTRVGLGPLGRAIERDLMSVAGVLDARVAAIDPSATPPEFRVAVWMRPGADASAAAEKVLERGRSGLVHAFGGSAARGVATVQLRPAERSGDRRRLE